MNVSEIMSRDVRAIGPDQPLMEAAHIMWIEDCGCIPVVDEERRPLAMITDRDVAMTMVLGGAADASVRRCMSDDVYTCREDDEVSLPHRIMREYQVRRLPVVDADGRLAGLLSLSDLAQVVPLRPEEDERRAWADEVMRTLGDVTRPREERCHAAVGELSAPAAAGELPTGTPV